MLETGHLSYAATAAPGQLVLARNASSYSNKFTAIFDLVDNSTSPNVEASRIMVDLKKSIRPHGPGKAKVRSELNALVAGACQTSLAGLEPQT